MTKEDIKARLINNDALFKNIYVFEQQFDIVPEDRKHYGAAVSYQDIMELRSDFLEQLIDTVVDWVYSSEKYAALKAKFIESGKSEATARKMLAEKMDVIYIVPTLSLLNQVVEDYHELLIQVGITDYIITSNLMIGESKAAHTIYVWTQEKAISGLSDHPSKGMPNKTILVIDEIQNIERATEENS